MRKEVLPYYALPVSSDDAVSLRRPFPNRPFSVVVRSSYLQPSDIPYYPIHLSTYLTRQDRYPGSIEIFVAETAVSFSRYPRRYSIPMMLKWCLVPTRTLLTKQKGHGKNERRETQRRVLAIELAMITEYPSFTSDQT